MDPEQEVKPEDVGRSLNDRGPFMRILIRSWPCHESSAALRHHHLRAVALSGSYHEGVAVIGSIDQSMPGYQAGLRAGDRIVSMDGQPIETFWQVRRYLDGYSPRTGTD